MRFTLLDIRDDTTRVLKDFSNISDGVLGLESGEFILLVILVVALTGLVFGFYMLISGKANREPRRDRSDVRALTHFKSRLTELESTMEQLVHERERAREFYQVEFDYLRSELERIADALDPEGTPEHGGPFDPGGSSRESKRKERRREKRSKTEHGLIESAADDPSAPITERVAGKGKSGDEDRKLGRGPTRDDLARSTQGYSSKTKTIVDSGDSDSGQNLRKVVERVRTEQGDQDTGEVGEKDSEQVVEPLKDRLSKSRRGFFGRLKNLFSGRTRIEPELLDDLEELLVTSDLGVATTQSLIEVIKTRLERGDEVTQDALLALIEDELLVIFSDSVSAKAIDPVRQADGPFIVLMVGVNGVGKTTTSAKLAYQWKAAGKRVLMVAADTFRAAAVDQLKHWGNELDIPVVAGEENAKPATVVFDALERADKENCDVVLVDTAGRLHTKSNLMQELEGVRNVIRKHQSSGPHEVLLVLDGSTGQNALTQAREFNDALDLTGLVITKLDGTPRGGAVVAIKNELGVPVRYIGVGEGRQDLRVFNPGEFISALLDRDGVDLDGAAEGESQPSVNAAKRRRRRRDTSWNI